MYALEATRLQVGDVFFTRDKTSSASWIIRAGTISDFSHAILYVGHHSFIDSDSAGVHSNNLQRLLFSRTADVAVKRLNDPVRPEILEAACMFARSQVGQQYSKTEAARAALPKTKRTPGDRQFCSRLVAQAYASAGITLVANPDFCTPQEIFSSSKLILVDNVHRLASPGEKRLAEDDQNPLKQQEEITNSFLKAVRHATGTDVSTMEAVAHLASQRPEFDGAIAGLLSASGYLTMWEWDMTISPHWYDPAVFARSIPAHEQAEVARHMFLAQEEALHRHQFNLRSMIALHSQTRSETVALFIRLEEKLCELCRQRLTVFKAFVR